MPELVVLKVRRNGAPPLEVQVPATATFRQVVQMVAVSLSDDSGWPGLVLLAESGERIPPHAIAGDWDGSTLRLSITHTNKIMGG